MLHASTCAILLKRLRSAPFRRAWAVRSVRDNTDKLLEVFGGRKFDEFGVKFKGFWRQFWVILDALEAIFAPLGFLEAPLDPQGTPKGRSGGPRTRRKRSRGARGRPGAVR